MQTGSWDEKLARSQLEDFCLVEKSSSINDLTKHLRLDLPGRFNEANLWARQWPRIAAMLQQEILPPYEVLVHASSGCNLACKWCIGDHVPIAAASGEILDAAKTAEERLPDVLSDPAAMERMVEGILSYRKRATLTLEDRTETFDFRIEAVSFSGLIGEPLVSKKAVLHAMRRLTDGGLRVGLFTNGVLMDEPTWDVLLSTGYVLVSLDAGTPETYGQLKHRNPAAGGMAFKRAVENVRGLARARRESGSALDINAAFILYPENHHEVYEAACILKDAGADCLRIKRDISGDRCLTPQQVEHTLTLLDRIEEDLVDDDFGLVRIHLLTDPEEGQRRFSRCTITDLVAAIGSDGNMYPCNYHPRPGGLVYGSVVEQPFQEVWEGSRRARLKQGLPGKCPACCDPFKNRANTMLATGVEIYERQGLVELARQRDEALVQLAEPRS